MKLNKKGGVGAEEILEFIPYIVLTVAVMAGIFLLINLFINITVDPKPLQREVLFNRLIYSPNSIMYMDQVTGRVYPGIIALDNFTNETLDKSITYSYERQIAAKLELYDQKKELVKTAYLNGVWYTRLEPLAQSRIKGEGSADIFTRTIPILYRKNSVNLPGYIKTMILIPN
ncbi:MAG: hypothetical protein KKF46_07100 [Nanoarchaeota archaeon]|nr:hypothetical protein [Nanoarchaeota archaeon]MBU1322095.1 hypothetical protein [Nanoarchaeota archaeon]MBU1597913.1 hypothetical protein [Nanoarchaeota archaeon]